MKIAFVQSKDSLASIFSKKSLEKIEKFGELVFNDGDASAEHVKKTAANADIAITSWGNTHFNEDILNCAPNLKLIAHAAGSVKPIVTDYVWERGIRVTGSPKPLGHGVAETTLGLMISALKNYYDISDYLHNKDTWRCDEKYAKITDMYDITIGIIGAGWAGRHFIKLLTNFDVDILVCDPFLDEQTAKAMNARKTELEELLKLSDVVSLHAPSIPETKHMINEKTLSIMKKDAVFINTARGSLVDEKALYEHMKKGFLKYACLDVFDPEPPAGDSPLRSLPNIILTPHIAGLCNNGRLKIGSHIANELSLFISGERMECEVTKEMIATMA